MADVSPHTTVYDSDDDDDEAPLLVSLVGKEEASLSTKEATTSTSASALEQPAALPLPELEVATKDDDTDVDQVTTDDDNDVKPCPVTILSGFLGSGKTTLIQFILQSPDHGKRIAVIENEFGGDGNNKEGLAVETIIARDGANQDNLTDLIELPNGCICCTVKDSLVSTLENLLDKRKSLDYILIEASGMANPGPIASLFWLDDALESRLRLDGIVTLVDAYHIERQLAETVEAAQQIAYSDRILLNKVDLIHDDDEEKLRTVVASIRAIHPTAPIRNTTFSQVPDLDWILDANCYDADRAKEVEKALDEIALHNDANHGEPYSSHSSFCTNTSCTTCHGNTVVPSKFLPLSTDDNHRHTSSIGTIALVEEGSVDLDRIHKWLASILWPNQDEQDKVLRARLENDSLHNANVSNATTATRTPAVLSSDDSPMPSMQLFRIKGIISVRHHHDAAILADGFVVEEEDEPYVDSTGLDARRFIVQAVHDLWEIHPASDEWQWDRSLDKGNDSTNNASSALPTGRTCKLVFIGRYLQEDELRAGFKSCLVDAAID